MPRRAGVVGCAGIQHCCSHTHWCQALGPRRQKKKGCAPRRGGQRGVRAPRVDSSLSKFMAPGLLAAQQLPAWLAGLKAGQRQSARPSRRGAPARVGRCTRCSVHTADCMSLLCSFRCWIVGKQQRDCMERHVRPLASCTSNPPAGQRALKTLRCLSGRSRPCQQANMLSDLAEMLLLSGGFCLAGSAAARVSAQRRRETERWLRYAFQPRSIRGEAGGQAAPAPLPPPAAVAARAAHAHAFHQAGRAPCPLQA